MLGVYDEEVSRIRGLTTTSQIFYVNILTLTISTTASAIGRIMNYRQHQRHLKIYSYGPIIILHVGTKVPNYSLQLTFPLDSLELQKQERILWHVSHREQLQEQQRSPHKIFSTSRNKSDVKNVPSGRAQSLGELLQG